MSLSQSDFFPGQRWLSEAEADLGLGVVTEYDERMVTIHFPASDETRNYAIRSAPLVRAAFGENDHIEDLEGRPMVVREVQQQGPLLGYLAVDTAGEEHLIPESDLNHRIRLNRPRERLLNGRIDRDIWFDIRYRTWINHERLAKSPVAGLIGPRVSLIPHQLHVANEVTGLSTPRVLLSDEVGLGKTIEAGLILHRLMHNGSLERALILVPETLLHQWLVELLRRFNLRVALFDKERFEAAADYDNPFLSEQLVLTSLSQLTDAPEMARAALGGQWDMLIVDEAHHLHWSESESSLEYDLVSALAEDTPGLMLLTATPEQLGKVGHFGRLRLLDPERFHSLEGFSREEQDYAAVADIGAKLLDDQALSDDETTLLAEMIGEAADLETEEARMQALERLLDRHGTGRVLFRNTRAAISGFPQRRLVEHALPEVAECSANGELLPENAMGEDWLDKDPRVQWLIDTLRELRPEKVLVICAQAETVLALRQALVDREGLHCAVFHEGLSIVERDRAAAYFADPYEGCQALICSEIGSEGRNFQFAHHLVLMDLPTEPDLLEQRIGRLDRIGQSEDIKIHVPVIQGSAMALLQDWYRDGLLAFERAATSGQAVRESLGDALESAIADASQRDALLERSRKLREEFDHALEAGRDRLLELHSHRPQVAKKLRHDIEAQDVDLALGDYMADIWAAFGVESEPGPGRTTVLHPGDHMMRDHFPQLPAEGTTLTLERSVALEREDYGFLSWEHPMTVGAMDMIMSETMGNTAFTVIQLKGIPPGTLLLELIYVAECNAPRELQVGRFLPPTPVRLLLDKNGKDHAPKVPHHLLKGECMSRERKTARSVIHSQAALIKAQFEAAEKLAQTRAGAIAETAMTAMHHELDEEISRMAYLSEVNPLVDEGDVELIRLRKERLGVHLREINVRLDAARLIIAA